MRDSLIRKVNDEKNEALRLAEAALVSLCELHHLPIVSGWLHVVRDTYGNVRKARRCRLTKDQVAALAAVRAALA